MATLLTWALKGLEQTAVGLGFRRLLAFQFNNYVNWHILKRCWFKVHNQYYNMYFEPNLVPSWSKRPRHVQSETTLYMKMLAYLTIRTRVVFKKNNLKIDHIYKTIYVKLWTLIVASDWSQWLWLEHQTSDSEALGSNSTLVLILHY